MDRPGAADRRGDRADGEPAEIAALTRASTLIELGSGSSEKTRLLLDATSSSTGSAGDRCTVTGCSSEPASPTERCV